MLIRNNQEQKMSFLQELHRKIKECSIGDRKYIQLIAKEIVTDKGRADQIEVTKLVETYLGSPELRVDFKLNIIEIMTQVLLSNKVTNYLKHFVTRFKFFIEKNAMNIKLNPQNLQRTHEIFQIWKQKKLFSEKFYKVLVNAAGPIFQVEQQKSEKQVFVFSKYTKSYLMGLRDIRKVSGAIMTYNECINLNKLNPIVSRLQQQAKQLDYSTESSDYKVTKAQQLLNEIDQAIQKYVDVMNNIQLASLQFKNLFMQQVNYLNMSTQQLINGSQTSL